jgi:predicted nucleic acid-binding protein
LLNVYWGWSVQVAGEFFVAATSPKRQFSSSTLLRALEIQQRFGLSYWDAAIIAAASELQCHTLYTEDLSDGQNYDGVVAINPFNN